MDRTKLKEIFNILMILVTLVVVYLLGRSQAPAVQPNIEPLPTETQVIEIVEPTESIVVEETPPVEENKTFGRLTIPSYDVSCQLNEVDITKEASSYIAQYYTDMDDSAAIFKHQNMYVIADHNTQSFANLCQVKHGDEARIEINGEVITLKCYRTSYGVIDGLKIIDKNGGNATTYSGYLMYTYDDSVAKCDAYLTFWR